MGVSNSQPNRWGILIVPNRKAHLILRISPILD